MPAKSFVPDKNKGDLVKRRQDLVKWNGWGYKDSYFFMSKRGEPHFSGQRYPLGGKLEPDLKNVMVDLFGIDMDYKAPCQPEWKHEDLPRAVINQGFMEELKQTCIPYSDDGNDRLFRGHGQNMREIYLLREGQFERIPDLVVWPEDHSQAVKIVELATLHNVVIIPFGGGTNVTDAVFCPPEEKRMIVSVDTVEMNRILCIDPVSMTVRAESGITGQDLERQLADRGFCTGHEPDSMEFSTLGGWVATRASGMKKNTYGNIEDMLINVKIVTPRGVIEKNCDAPRMSAGPDILQFVMGSEGTLGLITEVTLRLRPFPGCKVYGSIAFPDFESGLKCFRELTSQKCSPSSMRLMDNIQFRLGRTLRAAGSTLVAKFLEGMKKWYLTQLKGFDPLKLSIATLLFEGTKQEVAEQEKRVYGIAAKFGGIPGGSENGERGYQMTFLIAYIRDISYDYHVISESFETSVPWDRCLDLCQNVKERFLRESKNAGVKENPNLTYRITQTYDAGVCVYFYFAFYARELPNAIDVFENIMSCGRAEILANGGSISHHHGVGKVRTKWMQKTIGDLGIGSIQAVKHYIDPKNIFGTNNLRMGEGYSQAVQQESDHSELSFSSKL